MTARHDTPGGPLKQWRRSPHLAITAMLVIGLIQVGIPASLVGAEGVPRFGWQMFSADSSLPAFEVVKGDTTEPIALDEYMANARPEIDVVTLLPPHLCEVIPGAMRIVWDTGEWRC